MFFKPNPTKESYCTGNPVKSCNEILLATPPIFKGHWKFRGVTLERNGRKGSLVLDPASRWSTDQARELYDIASWGKGYFSIDQGGNVTGASH